MTTASPSENLSTASGSPLLRVCQLASGGMGQVELAVRQEGNFRRLFAVKRLHPHLREEREFRDMFMDEARVAGLLDHANIVSVLDVGQDDQGPYLVMSYVDGLSLSKLLSIAHQQGVLIPIQTCLRIAAAISRGLHEAHEVVDHAGQKLHLVHRDVSPQNILIGWDGSVRITDFGIAKALGKSTKTATGVVKGKASYMSPEQLRYEEIDHRSDLFSLGIVLYELLSGRRLYRGREGNEGIRRILNEAPPDIGEERVEAPPELAALLFELLAKDREQRPSSAAAVASRLERMLMDVLLDEPVVETSAVLDRIVPELREERSRVLAEQLASLDAEVGPIQAVGVAPDRRERSRSRPRVAALALGGALLLSAAALWYDGAAGSGDPPAAEPSAVRATDTASVVFLEPVAEPSASTAGERPVLEPTTETEAVPPEARRAEPAQPRRRARRQGRLRPSSRGGSSRGRSSRSVASGGGSPSSPASSPSGRSWDPWK